MFLDWAKGESVSWTPLMKSSERINEKWLVTWLLLVDCRAPGPRKPLIYISLCCLVPVLICILYVHVKMVQLAVIIKHAFLLLWRRFNIQTQTNVWVPVNCPSIELIPNRTSLQTSLRTNFPSIEDSLDRLLDFPRSNSPSIDRTSPRSNERSFDRP